MESVSPNPTTTSREVKQTIEATIAIRDLHYPFPEYAVATGTPYLHTETGLKQIRRKKVILRQKNGLEVVAIVGKNFALIPNEFVEDMTEKAIAGYGLTRLKVMKDRYENTLRIDLLTEKRAEVRKGDIVQFGVSIRNSIDGTSALAVDLFSYRLVCKNGATAKSADLTFTARHIGDPRELVKEFHKALAQVLERFDTLLQLYRKMAVTKLDMDKAKHIAALRLPEKYYKYTPILIREDGEVELRSHNYTLWDTFNDITNVLTYNSRAAPIARSYIGHRLHRVMQSIIASSA